MCTGKTAGFQVDSSSEKAFPRFMEEYRRRRVGELYPMDFDDVFGGPPKTMLLFRHPDRSHLPERALLHAEIFADVEDHEDFQFLAFPVMQPPRAEERGRNLPSFTIPGDRFRKENDFYDEVFSLIDRSSSPFTSELWRSKSTSANGSPLQASMADDVALSAFASKLMPINVRSQKLTDASCSEQSTDANWTIASVDSYMEYTDPSTDCHKQGTSLPNRSIRSMKTPYDQSDCNPEINSPLSVSATSAAHETDSVELPDVKAFGDDKFPREFAGGFTIQMMPRQVGEESNAVGPIDDVIAWVKEKYGTWDSKKLECEKDD